MLDLNPAEAEKRRGTARAVASAYRRLPPVCAIFCWGSTASGLADALSDVDMGIYADGVVPDRNVRLTTLRDVADDLEAAASGRFGRLEAFDKFTVSGIPVFVAWWRADDEEAFIRERLHRLPEALADRDAESELGELQEALVLWDRKGRLGRLRNEIELGLSAMRPQLVGERLSRARYDVDNLPRALQASDLLWAEECKVGAINELARVVCYLNGRFLRRLRGMDEEVAKFRALPPDFSVRLRRLALATPSRASAGLRRLLQDVTALAEEEQRVAQAQMPPSYGP